MRKPPIKRKAAQMRKAREDQKPGFGEPVSV
jgi:hypothetical protein